MNYVEREFKQSDIECMHQIWFGLGCTEFSSGPFPQIDMYLVSDCYSIIVLAFSKELSGCICT